MSWRIGIATGCCMEHGILEVLSAIHAAGLRGVEIGTPPNHFDPANRTAVRDVRERLQRLGMTPVSIHAPFGGGLELSAADPRERLAAVGRAAVGAAALKEIGGTTVVVHPTDIPRQEADVEQRLDRCADSLNLVAAMCRAMGLRLAIESPLPHLIGGSPEEFEWLLTRLDESVVVCLDTGHAALGQNWDRLLAVAGHRVAHIHANDHWGHVDEHLAPGDGTIDWGHIGSTLRGIDFQGWMMLELSCAGPHAAHFARAHERTRALLG